MRSEFHFKNFSAKYNYSLTSFSWLSVRCQNNFRWGLDLDILAQGAGIGYTLAYIHKKLKFEGKLPQNTLACGDSWNDVELFTIQDVHGILVNNKHEELLYGMLKIPKITLKVLTLHMKYSNFTYF